jgi:hypothetical protein
MNINDYMIALTHQKGWYLCGFCFVNAKKVKISFQ